VWHYGCIGRLGHHTRSGGVRANSARRVGPYEFGGHRTKSSGRDRGSAPPPRPSPQMGLLVAQRASGVWLALALIKQRSLSCLSQACQSASASRKPGAGFWTVRPPLLRVARRRSGNAAPPSGVYTDRCRRVGTVRVIFAGPHPSTFCSPVCSGSDRLRLFPLSQLRRVPTCGPASPPPKLSDHASRANQQGNGHEQDRTQREQCE
jgi:hypothetical protein